MDNHPNQDTKATAKCLKDKVLYERSLGKIKNRPTLQPGGTRNVKCKNEPFYKAKKIKFEPLVDVEFIEDSIRYTCILSRVRNSTILQQGDVRPVQWIDENFYKAKIKNIGCDGTVDVLFLSDKVKHQVTVDKIRDNSNIIPGDVREVKWKDGKYYPARLSLLHTL